MNVAIDKSGDDECVDICVDVRFVKLRIARFYIGIIADINYVAVLNYDQSVGKIVVTLLFVVKKGVGFECQKLSADPFNLLPSGLTGIGEFVICV